MMKSKTKIWNEALVVLGFIFLIIGSLLLGSFYRPSLDLYDMLPPFFQSIPISIIRGFSIFIIYIGFFIFNRSRKRLKEIQDVSKFNIDQSFVLYLRPFDYDQDDELMKVGGISYASFEVTKTIETQVSSAFKKIGKVISISNPKLDFQVLGSTKYKADESDWKDHVKKLIKEAQIVVITLGVSENVLWEISTALEFKKSREILFINPYYEEEINNRRDFFQQILDKFQEEKINITLDTGSLSEGYDVALLSIDKQYELQLSKASFISRLPYSISNQIVSTDVIAWLEEKEHISKSWLKKVAEWSVLIFIISSVIIAIWAFYKAFTN